MTAQTKKFRDLKNGDMILWFGVACVVSDIRVSHAVTGRPRYGEHIGDAVYRFRAERVPDDNRPNRYNFSSGVYTAVEGLPVAVLS